nr:alpha/beta fold hydrolase [Shouchella xiaoxiensis]
MKAGASVRARIVKPRPVYLKGGDKAVLLLHSFTSHTRDMKPLAKFLNEKGYTCYCPVYKGHGLPPEELFGTGPEDWWESVSEGYLHLKEEGHESIAVVGVSLGGIFALRVAQEFEVNGVVTMSVPHKRDLAALKNRVFKFAKAYKQYESKTEQEIKAELKDLEKQPFDGLEAFVESINKVMEGLSTIHVPMKIMYGELDETLYKDSAEYIFDRVATDQKSVNNYPQSKHLMTLGKDQEQIQADIESFLSTLQW